MLTAAQWGRLPFTADPMPGPIRRVFIHHTAAGMLHPDFAEHMRRMDRAARSEGYSAIEYSFLHLPDGRRAEGRGWGVESGATLGHNDDDAPGADPGYSMNAIGYYHPPVSDPVTAQLIDSIATTIAEGIVAGHIARDCRIDGHRDVRATACPGDSLYHAIPAIRARVAQLLAPPEEPEVTPDECRQIIRDEVPGLVRRVVRDEVTTLLSDLRDWFLRRGPRDRAPYRAMLRDTATTGSAIALEEHLRSPEGRKAATDNE